MVVFQQNYGGGEFGGEEGYDQRWAAQQSYQCPDAVAKFIVHLYKAISNRDIAEIENLYEIRYPQLTKDYFKEEKWPYDVSHLVDDPLVRIGIRLNCLNNLNSTRDLPSFLMLLMIIQNVSNLLLLNRKMRERIYFCLQFQTLYRELYFRHIYAQLPSQLTFSDRCNSYSNYCELFNLILSKLLLCIIFLGIL